MRFIAILAIILSACTNNQKQIQNITKNEKPITITETKEPTQVQPSKPEISFEEKNWILWEKYYSDFLANYQLKEFHNKLDILEKLSLLGKFTVNENSSSLYRIKFTTYQKNNGKEYNPNLFPRTVTNYSNKGFTATIFLGNSQNYSPILAGIILDNEIETSLLSAQDIMPNWYKGKSLILKKMNNSLKDINRKEYFKILDTAYQKFIEAHNFSLEVSIKKDLYLNDHHILDSLFGPSKSEVENQFRSKLILIMCLLKHYQETEQDICMLRALEAYGYNQ